MAVLRRLMITCRRRILDEYLDQHRLHMIGDVIDIGGKRENKRGDFRPPLSQVKSWQYVNIDKSTNPDFCCRAENIPVADAAFDTALLCEILEHLEAPEKVLQEAFRILKPGGTIIISTPFLFPVHADPYDFQRWTETKIKTALGNIGFSQTEITPMGGTGAVIHDLLLVSINKIQNRYGKSLGIWGLRLSKPLLNLMEKVFKPTQSIITTGYLVIARK